MPKAVVLCCFPQMEAPGHLLIVDVFYAHNVPFVSEFPALLVLPVLALVPYLLMSQSDTPLLLLVVGAAFLHLGEFALFPGKVLLGLAVKMRHVRLYALAVDIEVGAAVIQAEGLAGVQVTLWDVSVILRQDGDVILSRCLLTERDTFDFILFWNLPVEVHSHKAHFRELEIVPSNRDIPLNLVCCICFARDFFATELWKADGLIPKEVLIGGLYLKLGIAQGQRINFPQKWEFVFILRRSYLEHFPRFFVIGDFIRKHSVVNEPGTSDCFRKKNTLFRIWHCPKLVRLIHKITNFLWGLYTNYTAKQEKKQKCAIHPATLEVGDFLLDFVKNEGERTYVRSKGNRQSPHYLRG